MHSLSICLVIGMAAAMDSRGNAFDYQLLATHRASTLQTEMNAAATNGYRYSQFVGGAPSFVGRELVVAMIKADSGAAGPLKTYRVIAARTAPGLEKKLRQAGEDGFTFKEARLFHEGSGPEESVCIMEHDEGVVGKIDYKILTTVRTSTMQKELQAAGQDGFILQGMTQSHTSLGVGEVVAILSKPTP
jgi:hypothetical protein